MKTWKSRSKEQKVCLTLVQLTNSDSCPTPPSFHFRVFRVFRGNQPMLGHILRSFHRLPFRMRLGKFLFKSVTCSVVSLLSSRDRYLSFWHVTKIAIDSLLSGMGNLNGIPMTKESRSMAKALLPTTIPTNAAMRLHRTMGSPP